MKDNFSTRSDNYARFRPSYPKELFGYLLALAPARGEAWDCGTGNGQVAQILAETFRHVSATDISEQQLANAAAADNIDYSIQPAERTSFPDDSFDLITVAQAIHWFDFDAFYKEVDRTIRRNGILAVIGYGLITIDDAMDGVIGGFYRDVVGGYWDAERRYIDEDYRTIPFPYQEIKTPAFRNDFQWSFDHLIGYMETWSAVKHYEKKNRVNPVREAEAELRRAWGAAETKDGFFRILLRVGRPKG